MIRKFDLGENLRQVNSLPYRVTSLSIGNFIVYIGKFFIYEVTLLIGVVVYATEGRSLAGILTPTVRKFWRAYIEKTRKATSPAATPLI